MYAPLPAVPDASWGAPMDSPPTRTAEPSVPSDGLREIRAATERIAARQQALRAGLREMQAFLNLTHADSRPIGQPATAAGTRARCARAMHSAERRPDDEATASGSMEGW